MTAILIADDHPIFRAGLQVTIRSIVEDADVREVGHTAAMMTALSKQAVDLLVLDIFFPGLEPEDHIWDLRAAYPFMAILVVSMLTDRSSVERLLRAGANGFVSKSADPKDIEQGFSEVLAGERPVYLPRRGRGRPAGEPGKTLSGLPQRQRQVLELICMGLSNKEIARELDLSVSTVRAHVSALLAKLGVSNRAAAASFGAAHAVLSTSDKAQDRGA